MNRLRPLVGIPVLLLLSSCGTGEAGNVNGARTSEGAPETGAVLGAPATDRASGPEVAGEVASGGVGGEAATLATSPARPDADANALPKALVYKTPSCGCCSLWVDHMREAGFEVDARDLNDIIPVKMDAGVPLGMTTCHTTLIDGYVVEGHVPAEQVKRLLDERPDIVGIAVPGMPIGSPGMEGIGARPYRVLSWDRQGRVEVFAEVDPRR